MSKGLKLFLSILGAITILYALYGAFTTGDWTKVAGGIAIGGGLLSVNFIKTKTDEKTE